MDATGDRSRWPAVATAGALGVSVLLPAIELARIAAFEPARHFWIALPATVLYLVLHLRHVAFALGRRTAPGGAWSVAAIALIMVGASVAIGAAWSFMLASLVVSLMLVVRPPWSLGLAALVVIGSFVLATIDAPSDTSFGGQGAYITVSVVFRSVTLLVVVWLVAAIRELHATRAALAAEAVETQRARVATELGATLTARLETLAAQARRVGGLAASGDDRTAAALRELVAASRARLAETRRIVAGHRDGTDRRELEAAASLLRGGVPGGAGVPGGSSSGGRPVRDGGSGADVALVDAGRDAGGVSADPATIAPRAPADTPMDDALASSRRSRTLLLVVHLPMIGFLALMSATGLESYPGGDPPLAAVALLLGILQLRLSFAVARGERPRHGVATFVAMLALVVLGFVVQGYQWATAAWFVSAAGAMVFPGRRGAVLFVAGVATQASLGISEFFSYDFGTGPEVFYCAYVVTISAMGGGAIYGAARLTRVADQLASTRAALTEQAVSGERRRFSRDLHDALGQSLSAISLKGDLAAALLHRDPPAAAAELRGIAEVAEHLADDVRTVASDGRPTSFVVEAAGAVELLRAAGVDAEVDVDLPGLTTEADALFGWAVREGATNVLRHSDAQRCVITAVRDDGRIGLELVNDGASATEDGAGSGLAGLADRAGMLRGVVSTDLDEGRFRLRVLLPEDAA